jgi:hypothetical protein
VLVLLKRLVQERSLAAQAVHLPVIRLKKVL